MKYFAVTPKWTENQCIVFDKIVNQTNLRLVYPDFPKVKIDEDGLLYSSLFSDGIEENLMFNIDSMPIVSDALRIQLGDLNVRKVTFVPIRNDKYHNFYAMLIYNEFEYDRTRAGYFSIDKDKVSADIFRLKGISFPMFITESVKRVIDQYAIENISIVEMT